MIKVNDPPEQPEPPVHEPVEPPPTDRKKKLISWLKKNALLLTVLTLQGYTLYALDDVYWKADIAKFWAKEATDEARSANWKAESIERQLYEIISGSAEVQCSRY